MELCWMWQGRWYGRVREGVTQTDGGEESRGEGVRPGRGRDGER